VIDPYEAVKDFLNRAEFWEYYAELWPAVEGCYKKRDRAQTKSVIRRLAPGAVLAPFCLFFGVRLFSALASLHGQVSVESGW
jgi:hypothetical protein